MPKWNRKYSLILRLDQEALTDDEISKKVGLSSRQVRRIKQFPEYQERYEKVSGKIRERIEEKIEEKLTKDSGIDQALDAIVQKVPEATEKIVTIMREGKSSDRIQYEAAKHILDMAGLKPVEVVETRERSYSPEEIASAKETLKEITDMTARLTNPESRFILHSPSEDGTSELTGASVTDEKALAPESHETGGT